MNAIRRGLEKVVPKAVLTLMTWQELEQRICGEPEITVEALKKSGTHPLYSRLLGPKSTRRRAYFFIKGCNLFT